MTASAQPPLHGPGVGATLTSLAALLTLTALTTGLAFTDTGPGWELVIALSIACLKAGIILAVFMQLARASRLKRTVTLTGLAWLLLLLAGVLADLTTRVST